MEKPKFQSKEEYAEWFKSRTKAFAVDCIKFCKDIPFNQASKVVVYQLIKSVTSLAANYRAACRARSQAEFFSKICIVVEEADETLFWLEMLQEAGISNSENGLEQLKREAEEILRISSKARKTSSVNRKTPPP